MSEARKGMKSAASRIQPGSSLENANKQLFGIGQENYTPSQVPIAELVPFQNHPFHLYDEERMTDMVESVRTHGIIAPVLVRPLEAGGYEIVAGHNRVEAARQAGLSYIPASIRELDDETATIIMVDSNLKQREQLLPSEKAFAYRMKLEAIRRQAGRPANNCDQVGHNYEGKKSIEIIAESADDSRNQIQRYIRLTYLISPLMERVDANKMAFTPAVAISYLSHEEQEQLFTIMDLELASPSVEQAERMKEASQAGGLSYESIHAIMKQEKPNQREKPMFTERITKLLPEGTENGKIEDYIVEALEFYNKAREKARAARKNDAR